MSFADYQNDLNSPYVRAALDTIAWCEGADYDTLFGGGTFSDYSQHPNRAIHAGGYTSTAAGRYQFLYSTWRDTQAALGLPDFSPASQDIGAVYQIDQRGALGTLLNGDFQGMLQQLGCLWASLPYSGCGQGEKSLSSVLSYYNDALAVYQLGGGATLGAATTGITAALGGSNSDLLLYGLGAVLVYLILSD